MDTFSKRLVLILLINLHFLTKITVTASFSTSAFHRKHVVSIAKQLGYGIKRGVYYLDTLVDNCDSSNDLNNWTRFVNRYLTCDAKAESPKLKQLGNKGHAVQRLSLVCKHWHPKMKCSYKLATKLNSCLGSHLEDGRAGTNGLRLAEAHMKFLCSHRIEYAANIAPDDGDDKEYFVPVERRPLNCYREMESSVAACILEKEQATPMKTFCQKFQAAKECISIVYARSCEVTTTFQFMETMLDQLEFDLEC